MKWCYLVVRLLNDLVGVPETLNNGNRYKDYYSIIFQYVIKMD